MCLLSRSIRLIYLIALQRRLQKLKFCFNNSIIRKTRSAVKGGGRKPWKQKGTGNARAGSIRSPLWRSGGKSFGPQFMKKSYKINFKQMFQAKLLLFLFKFRDIRFISEPTTDFFFALKNNKDLLIIKLFKKYIFQKCLTVPTKSLIIISLPLYENYFCNRFYKFKQIYKNNLCITAIKHVTLLHLLQLKYCYITTKAIDSFIDTLN
jgi:hypothetical protein